MSLRNLFETVRKGRARLDTQALLRVAVGAVFVAHGWQKLSDAPGTVAAFGQLGFPLPAWSAHIAMFSELLGGLALAVGMRTRLVALALLLTTAGAMFLAQSEHGFVVERGGSEYSLLLCALCLHFAVRGAGIYSIDALVAPRRPRFRRRHRQVAATT